MGQSPVKQISREAYLELFDESVHPQILAQLDDPQTLGVVCYENLEIRYRAELRRASMPVGPQWTLKTFEDTGAIPHGIGRPIGTAPGNFVYPVSYYRKNDEAGN